MANTRIGFTACSKINFDEQQPVWTEMAAQQPQHLLLLGDQIYMDFWRDRQKNFPPGLKGYELDEPAGIPDAEFAQQMRLRYRLQFAVPSFHALVRQVGAAGGTVAMVWDDHDFGFNNSYGRAGSSSAHVIAPAKKRIARALFEEFRLNVDRLRAGTHPGPYEEMNITLPDDTGVQSRHTLGSARVLMLDTRTFRQPPAANNPPASLQPELLGQKQWDELENEIRNAPQKLIIIGSGSPFTAEATLSDQSWKQGKYAKFSSYREYDRLVALAASVNRRIVFIGGDSHKVALVHETPGLAEVICAGAAAPKGPLFLNARHFGLLDIDDAGNAQVSLFARGKVKIREALFGQGVTGPAIQHVPGIQVPAGQPGWQREPRERKTTAFMLSTRRIVQPTGDGQQASFGDANDGLTCWITEARPNQWRNMAQWKEVPQAEFMAALMQHLERSEDAGEGGQLCFYAHGALHDWLDTAGKFARVVHGGIFAPRKLGVPVFISWPAIKTVQIATDLQDVYGDTLANAQQAGRELGDFIGAFLAQVPEALKAGRLPLTLLASSMGNQLLASALRRLHTLPAVAGASDVFRRWVMLAADLDSDLFAATARDPQLAQAIADLCLDVVATALPQDDVLAKVQAFSGGLARVGQAGFVDVRSDYASWAHAIGVARIIHGERRHASMLETPEGVAFTGDALGGMSVLEMEQKYR